ncbi:Alpha/Beta hydrolase protein [Schizothecium vesticola]|uniref:Alpha/Beta hydrolase protein n=1 Tax=Schizothecium vesticola TaxID=314040 RepID=A0AA40BQA0_9PEZI|nr:Alpha/Beta hydrolase protein [Schizothecium vesticola]
MAAVTPPPDKLVPNDPRVTHHTVTLNGHKWHYLLGTPPSSVPPAGTILLVHGHPDLAFGWRYQVPYLLSLNLRVIVPDMLGYGDTDAPEDPAEYSHRKICASLAALIRHVLPDPEENPRVLLGGHDWGGAVVWKFAALWHPEMVAGVFSVCTPYGPPQTEYGGLEALVERVPNFRYQLQLAGEELEELVTREGLVGGTRKGLHGPLNWYRTGKVNFEEEREVAAEGPARWMVTMPAMMISAKKDPFLPPWMSANMDRLFDDLVKHEVDASHWALWEAPNEVNGYIGEFVKRVLGGEKPLKASI